VAEEAENTPANRDRSWTPVVPVPQETVAVAMFQWKRLPITKKVVLRYCAIFVAIVIGTAILGYVVSSMGGATYGARSEITYPLAQGSASGGFLREDRTLQTQLVAIKSQAVLQPVADKFKIPIDELTKKITATVVEDSNVIRFQVVDGSRARALQIVGAVVAEYFKNLPPDANTLQEGILSKQITSFNSQIEELNAKIASLETTRVAAGVSTPVSAAELQAQSQVTDLLSQRTTAQTQLNTATAQQAQQPRVLPLTQPYAMGGKVSPKPLQGAIAGFLAGIMIAILVIGLLIRRLLKREPDPVG
jgi:capsular polysaccharide biosynthesis protein